MKKLILLLMVFMVACAIPALACTDCNISEKGSSLHAPFSQNDLVETPVIMAPGFVLAYCATCPASHHAGVMAILVPLSQEVTFSPYSEPAVFLSLDKMNPANTDNAATYNPGHAKFDYGPGTIG